ncbi:hypothetical protein V7793_07385 [Streptomyces sp. KLMMK]|uniref:hypothetical protein n=1 Tax=Streptomyces sp. KLMMK TaxID=3109353 RepID=UPI002FFE032D
MTSGGWRLCDRTGTQIRQGGVGIDVAVVDFDVGDVAGAQGQTGCAGDDVVRVVDVEPFDVRGHGEQLRLRNVHGAPHGGDAQG